MLGFGMGWYEEWLLMPDGRVLHRTYLGQRADAGVPGNRRGEASSAWSEETLTLAEVPMLERRQLLSDAMGRGWQPPTLELRQLVIAHGLEDGLLSDQDRLGWTPPGSQAALGMAQPAVAGPALVDPKPKRRRKRHAASGSDEGTTGGGPS